MLMMMSGSKRRTLQRRNQLPVRNSSMLYLGNVASFDPSGTISKFGHCSPTLYVSFVASGRESKNIFLCKFPLWHFRSHISSLMICGARYLSGRMPGSQSREPGLESPLLPFRSSDIFVLSMMPQFTQLYK